MDEPRPSQPGPPAVRPQAPFPAVPQPPAPPPPAVEPPRAPWTRLTRTARGTAGLGIGAAAVLLWPFSGWSWIPWAAGLGTLVLLALLRLDRLLRGWTWHVAGVVVVAGLMVSTTPWAWALAAGIGVLAAGLLQLPEWRLAAAGAVLCVIGGVGFTLGNVQDAQQAREVAEQSSAQSFALTGERSPQRVLPALLEGIGQGDVPAVCGLLDVPAREAFVRAAGTADCPAAVLAFRAAARIPPDYDDLEAPTVERGGAWTTNGCSTAWARPPLGGPQLGTIDIRKSDPPARTYFLAAFRPC